MRLSNWNVQIIENDDPFIGPSTIKWKCRNKKDNTEETVTTKLKEEKTYPEENFKYEGEVNGKKVEGDFITGHGSTKSIRAVVSENELTDAERAAGVAHIDWMC